MTSFLDAGLAWAVPVLPDTLGAHLEAYAAGLPAITALRLCHQFGTGPAAHITRLPRELIILIEDYIHAANGHLRSKPDCEWRSTFTCFQSQCEPRKHEGDWSAYSAVVDRYMRECDHCTKNTMYDNKCSWRCPDELNRLCPACAEDKGPEACYRTCRKRRELKLNQMLCDHAAFSEQHEMNKRTWMDKIRQGPASRFAKYDRLLLQHFGLEAFFTSTQIGRENVNWPRDFQYRWHARSDIGTTLCYLTLPRAGGPSGMFGNSSTNEEQGRIRVEAAQALPVDLASLATPAANMRRRFTAAMKALALTPSVHPSQELASPVSANKLKMRKDDGRKDAERNDEGRNDEGRNNEERNDAERNPPEPDDILGPDYPQLTLLVNTRFHYNMETTRLNTRLMQY
ncbi:hypothetical protein KC332_g8769 [Hortaea werneckii]|uniref:Uncharacterized protein n=2 Tax=Hortaea werneckii TaxID=91943 RepID=A0A3M7J1X1_HORWE|nr:hypothetical protein KC350_g9379 [Hortaea werneckii]OTA34906.1 hypothetical protein BTJ68_05545 [Hortaea werneckii EXF-2000]KAI6849621.1 hypothetical protein KC358_g1123 [Hortaea werneckii]KAI6935850.1 hypothetical protein KC341_g6640 [Hortaea werneckii]KAI6949473.1 hypothetical protein KC348_g1307 [Hortaea werneckii]